MAQTTDRKLRVAICGAGIGGLTLAAFLSRSGNIQVDVFERKPVVSELGAGIALWKRSWEIYQKLGFEEDCAKRNIPAPKDGEVRGPIFRKSDQLPVGVDFHSHVVPYGPTSLPRPILMDILMTKISFATTTIHTSKQLTHYTTGPNSTSSVVLHFEDGTTHTADVLIGCDGVHSRVRSIMYKTMPELAEPIWSGQIAYRFEVKQSDLRENHTALDSPRIWCGKGGHIVTIPLGSVVTMVCFRTLEKEGSPFSEPWMKNVTVEEVVSRYPGWEPDVISLLEHAIEPISRWAIHVVKPIPHSTSGNVALVGDSAHAMTPHQGVGGGQAIEDAYILGRLLIKAAETSGTSHLFPDILKIYEKIRLPLAKEAAIKSLHNGLFYDFLIDGYENERLAQLGEDIGTSFKWLSIGGVENEWLEADNLLSEVIANAKIKQT